jgi:putative hydroxymethylpyrimidine transport system ATP-binding protein
MSNDALQFKEVSFAYNAEGANSQRMLDSVNLNVTRGEFISIIGASGSGKTTIFKLITGLEQPTAGKILLDGSERKDRLGHVGYMPQQDLLMPWRTIIENAALPLEIQGVRRSEAHKRVKILLQEFGLQGVEKKYPGDLSGGMKQRVSFLRTILSGANVLLLDEPFSALDAITKLTMQEWLLVQWQKRENTILFITHDVDEALFLSDRIFVLTDTPIRELKEIVVPLSRPRTIRDMNSTEVVSLKEQLLRKLRHKVML